MSTHKNLRYSRADHDVRPRFDNTDANDAIVATEVEVQPHSRSIIGGTAAPPGRYPYAAAITTDTLSLGLIHECGATLIGPDLLLTAAHCKSSSVEGLQINSAVLGRYERSNIDKSKFEYFPIEHVLVHPDYIRYPVPVNDLKIIKLYGKSTYTPIRLNSNPNFPRVGGTVTAMGWGSTNTDDWELSNVLREVDLGYVSNEQCGRAEGVVDGSFKSYVGIIGDSMLCSFAAGRDSCLGDSGGSLIVRGNDAGSDVQVGVSSFGISCATMFPGVSTRISSHYEW